MSDDNSPRGAAIELDDVSFGFDGARMHFDLAVAAGTVVAIMGASGSGKTTLLNLIAGFEKPEAGRVLIGGRDVTDWPPSARPVSMVFQENNLFAHLDVAANVGLGRSPSLRLSEKDRTDVSAALEHVGLGGKERRLPGELSGGERQRVALARVLLRRRPVLLLDEPFASLGPGLRREMLSLLADLQARLGMTVLMVTHHPEDARALAGHVAFLSGGRIEAFGEADRFFSDTGPQGFRNYIEG
ncbi:thiamine ABC transporter ATP-binding protein [Chelativorans sp. ZYF759]|uniref:thiamine ABC transporter ATP-binding protein n=1 Tax=Chelativorans sp. ZYF759 TaxID=2692213 RepID=UPI00145F113B|nr:thiamine ABC transporter ATP-binding protein [Chelativorans sp. ZYF759]NMG40701.1 thiamine ABC transporter ATP-binding protein [Chelativorans sp. ZYF759]